MDNTSSLPIQKADKPPVSQRRADWHPIQMVRQEIDRLFERLSNGRSEVSRLRMGPDLDLSFPLDDLFSFGQPAVDVVERATEYEVSAELPGLDRNDIEVKIANGMLTLSGEKRDERQEHRKDFHFAERHYGSFLRSFVLPTGIDQDRISADFAKGVLTVRLPKTPEALASEKKIEVKAA
jgi:HSP20 family protein